MSRAASVKALAEHVASLERPLLIALDVDGTLAPIVQNPGLAEIPERTRALLEELAQAEEVVLALVTGRDLRSLERLERIDGIWRAVEHGGLILPPGERADGRTLTAAQRSALDRFRDWVDQNANDAFVEYKPQAIALHVRGIAEHDSQRAELLMAEADALATGLGLHVRRGKALREAEAVQHDKGSALAEILRRTNAASAFFAGDDLTDFSAIELAATRGVGVFVRSDERPVTPSERAVVVDGIDQMSQLLHELCRQLRG